MWFVDACCCMGLVFVAYFPCWLFVIALCVGCLSLVGVVVCLSLVGVVVCWCCCV